MVKARCSIKVADYSGFYFHACTKPATVVQDGRSYCTIHDPARRKAKDAEKCWEQIRGRICGRPAVEVSRTGFGRCASHTASRLIAEDRLRKAGHKLLMAARAAYSNGGLPSEVMTLLEKAIAEAEG